MSYRFQSKAAGDVLMLGPAGDGVLGAMGLAPAAQGIIQVAAMPAAIRALEAAIAQEDARSAERDLPDDPQALSDDVQAVSLRQRAWPLMDMIRRSQVAGEAIVWGV